MHAPAQKTSTAPCEWVLAAALPAACPAHDWHRGGERWGANACEVLLQNECHFRYKSNVLQRTCCKFLLDFQSSVSLGKDTPQKCNSNTKSCSRKKLQRQGEFGFPTEILVQITYQQKLF